MGPWGEAMKFRWEASLIVAAFAVVIGLVVGARAGVLRVAAEHRRVAIRFTG